MVSIKKEEDLEEAKSDSWLSYWTNHPDNGIKKEEKYDKSGVKIEFLENSIESKSKIGHEKNAKDKDILLRREDSGLKICDNTMKIHSEIGQNSKILTIKKSKITAKVTKIVQRKSLNKEDEKVEISHQQYFSDKVADLCEFKCPTCGEKFTSKQNIGRHFRKTKHAISKNRGINLKDFLTRISYYKCQMCDQSVICDKSAIRGHLQYSHKISLWKYIERNNVEYTSKHPKFLEMHQIVYTGNESQNISKTIGNYCVFSCKNCEFTCQRWDLMTLHKSKHKHGQDVALTKHTRHATFYKCQICDVFVLCDKTIIKSHLQNHQKITLSGYMNIYHPLIGGSLFAQYKLELKSAVKKISYAKNFLTGDLLSVFPTTGDTGNISFFKCPDCSKTDMSYKQLLTHCKQEHLKRKVVGYVNNIKEARYHSCHICAKKIICDNFILRIHLGRTHRVNLSTYSKEYVLKNGFRVYPTFQDYINDNNIFGSTNRDFCEGPSQDKEDNGFISPSMISSESEDSDES